MTRKLLESRRQFLSQAVFGSLAFSTVSIPVIAKPFSESHKEQLPPSMTTPGNSFSNYGQPSPYEQEIIRWISASPEAPGNGVSWTPLHDLQGTITPNGLHFERHHNGVPDINPDTHQVLIDGLVEHPLLFSIAALKRYPQVSKTCFIECGGNSNSGWKTRPNQSLAGYAHGLISNSEWTGVPVKYLLHEANVQPKAQWGIAEAADAASLNVSIPLDKLMDDALIALYQNGERLRPENGYPCRLVIPGWEGITNVKWLRQLRLSESPAMTRNETSKYTELVPNGKAEQFTFIMEAKSLITSPSIGMQLNEKPGIYQVTGLAWSGRGKIIRVEVSADGGMTWVNAELHEPILDRAFTRFSLPWKWEGQPAILQSRATDETGYQQPTREKLVNEKGTHGFFHYNAIVSWEVTKEGDINHVYL